MIYFDLRFPKGAVAQQGRSWGGCWWWGFLGWFFSASSGRDGYTHYPWMLLHALPAFLHFFLFPKSPQGWSSPTRRLLGITWAHSREPTGVRDGEKAVPANHQVHSVQVFNGPIKYSKCKSHKLPWKGFSRFKNGAIFWIYDSCLRAINKKVVYPEGTGKCYLGVCIFGRFLGFPFPSWPFPKFSWLQEQTPRCHSGNELSKEWTEIPAGWFIHC